MFHATRFSIFKILPTQAMIKSEAPPEKQKEPTDDEEYTRRHSVYVKIALLQAKDVYVRHNSNITVTIEIQNSFILKCFR